MGRNVYPLPCFQSQSSIKISIFIYLSIYCPLHVVHMHRCRSIRDVTLTLKMEPCDGVSREGVDAAVIAGGEIFKRKRVQPRGSGLMVSYTVTRWVLRLGVLWGQLYKAAEVTPVRVLLC